jgi:hypothetical protein
MPGCARNLSPCPGSLECLRGCSCMPPSHVAGPASSTTRQATLTFWLPDALHPLALPPPPALWKHWSTCSWSVRLVKQPCNGSAACGNCWTRALHLSSRPPCLCCVFRGTSGPTVVCALPSSGDGTPPSAWRSLSNGGVCAPCLPTFHQAALASATCR